jgi:hypothetical protein
MARTLPLFRFREDTIRPGNKPTVSALRGMECKYRKITTIAARNCGTAGKSHGPIFTLAPMSARRRSGLVTWQAAKRR